MCTFNKNAKMLKKTRKNIIKNVQNNKKALAKN